MPASVTVRVNSNRLPQVAAAAKSAVVEAVSKTAFQIQADAQRQTPVKTGTLRRSIHTIIENGGLTAKVGPSVFYGLYIELGTRRMAARPYMRPAAELNAPRFVAAVRAALAGLK